MKRMWCVGWASLHSLISSRHTERQWHEDIGSSTERWNTNHLVCAGTHERGTKKVG